MYTIYHNPRCSKSRQALQILESSGLEVVVKNYMEEGFTKEELLHIKHLLNKEIIEFTRTKEAAFKEKGLTKESTDDELIQAMIEEPKLFERPVVIHNNHQAVLGRPPELVQDFMLKM